VVPVIASILRSTQRIMSGDLSGRLPVGRSGDELDRLAENLNTMLERIETLMSGLKEVSDNIAHDLKTPLTRLRNRAEEALARAGTETEYRAALERTIEESDGLIRTFNALLMIARAESGQARGNMDVFDAAEVAAGIQELYEPLAEDADLVLKVEASIAPVYGNRELISQALANLVENAIKYGKPETSEGAPAPEILIEARRESDQVLLSVSDSGAGIPEIDRKHAVERFVRLEASRTLPGSGLGLSLASAVATLHSGELRLGDNNPGLRVTLVLPAATGEALAGQSANVQQKSA
jgi:signal transduction histidine kinase